MSFVASQALSLGTFLLFAVIAAFVVCAFINIPQRKRFRHVFDLLLCFVLFCLILFYRVNF